MSYRKRGGILTAIIIILIIALIVGMLAIFTSGFRNWDPSTWFKQTEETPDPTPEVPPVVDENGNAMDSETVYPMPQKMLFSPLTYDAAADTYSTYQVTINATIEPADATNQGVNWSVAWKNAASTWATGKNVTQYVVLNTSGKTATVICSLPFGEQIILTAASAENPEINATCTVDYLKAIDNLRFDCDNYDPMTNPAMTPLEFLQDSTSVSMSLWAGHFGFLRADFGVGTVGGSINIDKLDIAFAENVTLDSSAFPFNYSTSQTVVNSEENMDVNVNMEFQMTAENYKTFYNYFKPFNNESSFQLFTFTYTLSSDYYSERTFTTDVWFMPAGIEAPYVTVTGITVDSGSLIIDGMQPQIGDDIL